MAFRIRFWVAAAMVALACLGENSAWAEPSPQDRETARSLMDSGDRKAEAKNLEGALADYKAAHALVNVTTTGYAVARTLAELGRWVEARDTALSVGHMPIGPKERAPIKAAREAALMLADSLGEKIPSIVVQVGGISDLSKLKVEVDGVVIPNEALGHPRKVDPGKHSIRAKADGYEELVQMVEVRERDTVTVTMPINASSKETTKTASGLLPLVYVGFGTAAAGLIAGAVTGTLALSKAGTVHEVCPENRCATEADRQRVEADRDRGLVLSYISTGALVVGAVGAGVGVAGLVLSGGPSKKEEARRGMEMRVGAGYIGVSGRF